mgnify:CR=1 FL=1
MIAREKSNPLPVNPTDIVPLSAVLSIVSVPPVVAMLLLENRRFCPLPPDRVELAVRLRSLARVRLAAMFSVPPASVMAPVPSAASLPTVRVPA